MEILEALCRKTEAFLPTDGRVKSPLSEVWFFRQSRPVPQCPVVYNPCIVFLFQGHKTIYFDGAPIPLHPGHVVIAPVPIPARSEVSRVSKKRPLLGVRVQIDDALLQEMLMQADPVDEEEPIEFRAFTPTSMDETLGESLFRLLDALSVPESARILGPGCVREVMYRVFKGPEGHVLRALARKKSHHFSQIARTLRLVHTKFNENLDVRSLAKTASMSDSTFHEAFRKMTKVTPLQYLKQIRLHEARTLIVYEGRGVAEASYAVGYNSPSQFTREYRRHYGISPSAERRLVRGNVNLQSA